LLGTTGSGKTTGVRLFLQKYRVCFPFDSIYILDNKNEGDFRVFEGDADIEGGDDAPLHQPQRQIQIWRPVMDDKKQISVWLEHILRTERKALVILDELSTVTGSNVQTMPDGYPKIMKQARGKGITVISLTQEAAFIPRQTLGMTTHIFRFFLQDIYDRQKTSRMFEMARKDDNPFAPYGLFVKKKGDRSTAKEYNDIKEVLSIHA